LQCYIGGYEIRSLKIWREFGIGSNTVVDWRNFSKDVCAQYFEANTIKIGGPVNN